MRYQLVVFDIAGTTVADPGLVETAFRDAMAAAGSRTDAATLRALMGYAKPEAISRLLRLPVDAPEVQRVHADFQARMLDCVREDPRVQPLPGAEDVFRRLRRHGLQVALDTGFCRRITAALLQRLGWEPLVDAWVASDEVPRGRPWPDMIQALMQRCDVADAAALAKVGDTAVDIEEGRNAGVGLCVAVSTGAFAREALASRGADRVIDHLDELPGVLGLPTELH